MLSNKKLLIILCSMIVLPIATTGCATSLSEQEPSAPVSPTVIKGNGTFTPTAKNIRVYRTAHVDEDGQQALMVYGVISDPFAGDAELYNSGSTYPNLTITADISQEVKESSDITNEGFIAKVTLDGTWQWAKTLPLSVNSTPAFTKTGVTYFTTYNNPNSDDTSFNETGRADMVNKMDTQGNVTWTKTVKGAYNFTGASIAIAPDESLSVVSVADSGNTQTGFGDSTSIAKISTNGDTMWNYKIPQYKPVIEYAMVAPMTTNAFDMSGNLRTVLSSPTNSAENYKIFSLTSEGKEKSSPIVLSTTQNSTMTSYSFSNDGKTVYTVNSLNSDPTAKTSNTELQKFNTQTGTTILVKPSPPKYTYSYVASDRFTSQTAFVYLLPVQDGNPSMVEKTDNTNTTTKVFPNATIKKGYDPVLSTDTAGKVFFAYSDSPYLEPSPTEMGSTEVPKPMSSKKITVRFSNS